jgi:hypothetical protein
MELTVSRNYNAFLIRHWSLDAERGKRIEVVHVQSGDRSLVNSLAQAANWMQTWADSEGQADAEHPAVAVEDESTENGERPRLPPILV